MQLRCRECKKELSLEDVSVYADRAWWHYDCFVSCCQRKSSSKRTSPKWGEYLTELPALLEESERRLRRMEAKEEVLAHITQHYFQESKIPNSVYQKLAAYYDGTMKGMSVPLEPEHLADMWRKKQAWLNTVYHRNQQKGNDMTPTQRVSYDLAILAGKYHSYLEWLERQAVKTDKAKEKNPTAALYQNQNTQTETKSSGLEVNADLLKDVFG